jgi:ArsR family transcriptional regulator
VRLPLHGDSIGFVAPNLPALTEEQLQHIARAVADPRRFQILKEISRADRQLVCSDLLLKMPIAPATLSHHTKELEQAGLITIERLGKFAHLSLRRDTWEAYLAHLAKL